MRISLHTKIDLWRKRRRSDYCAECPNGALGLRPENVDTSVVGHHLSVVFTRGKRVYNFENEENRDAFVRLYGHLGAKPCEDPYP